jgi:signal transduction histidine kinase
MAVVYAGFGRRLVQAHIENGRAVAFVTAELILFFAAVACSSLGTFLLFAVVPMIFLALPLRAAVWFVIAVNLGPVLSGLITDGFTMSVLAHHAPIALVSIAFALWFGYWVSRVIDQSSERAVLIAELEQSRAEVGRLSHEAGVAAERARLAGEIHDTVAQGFTSIIALLQAADPGLTDERLALAVRTARENLAESRALIAALSPSALATGSLPDAIRRQVSRFTEESGIPATLRLTGEARELPTAAQVVLLRATQEALNNARRHAGAGTVAVVLAYAETTVRLAVRDDGCGFDPAEDPGFGLRGMRARAEQVAGVLRITSQAGSGTTIELEVPA